MGFPWPALSPRPKPLMYRISLETGEGAFVSAAWLHPLDADAPLVLWGLRAFLLHTRREARGDVPIYREVQVAPTVTRNAGFRDQTDEPG